MFQGTPPSFSDTSSNVELFGRSFMFIQMRKVDPCLPVEISFLVPILFLLLHQE